MTASRPLRRTRHPNTPTPIAQAGPVRAPRLLSDEDTFADALAALAEIDAAFMGRLDAIGARPALRRREPGFEGLAAIVVSQQVSTAAASAIFAKLCARFGTPTPGAMIAAPEDDLRSCGLSAGKARTIKALAAAVIDGTLPLAGLATATAEEAHRTLTATKGIGPWTADIFLLFCLGHADAWPAGDLALQEAARLVLQLEARPDARGMAALGDRWRPLRGVAAHCLWAYYHAARGRAATLAAEAVEEKAPPRRRTKARASS